MKVVFMLSWLLGAAALLVTTPGTDDRWFQAFAVVLAAGGLATYYIVPSRRRVSPGWASLTVLFTVGYVIVNLQIPITRLFGVDVSDTQHAFIWSEEDVYNQSIGVSVLGLLSFLCGASIGGAKAWPARPEFVAIVYSDRVISLVAVASFVVFIAVSGTYALGDYTNNNASAISSYAYKLSKVSLTAWILIKVHNYHLKGAYINTIGAYMRHLGAPLVVLLIVYAAIALLVGDRAPLIYFVLLTFVTFAARNWRLGWGGAIAIAYLSSVALSIIGAARQARFGGEALVDRLIEATAGASWWYHSSDRFEAPVMFGQLVELASSVRALNHAIANVPSRFDFAWGNFALQQIASVVPGLGGLLNRLLNNGVWWMDGTANFITFLIQGASPSYGDGTSVTADLYVDFGVVGVAAGLLLFGVAVGRNEYRVVNAGSTITLTWVFVMCYFANAAYLSRSGLLLELSNVVLVFVLIMTAGAGKVVKVPVTHAAYGGRNDPA